MYIGHSRIVIYHVL